MNPVPGSSLVRSYVPREILVSSELGNPGYDGGVIEADYAIDGGNTGYTGELRPGTIMGRITASKRWVPCKRTKVNASGATAASFAVDDARAFKAGDTISVASDDVTILSINYSTNTITLTGSITFADNDDVVARGTLAGAEIPRGILHEHVDLYDHDTRANVDRQVGRIITSNAKVNTAMVLGDLTNCRAATGQMLGQIQFYTNGVQV